MDNYNQVYWSVNVKLEKEKNKAYSTVYARICNEMKSGNAGCVIEHEVCPKSVTLIGTVAISCRVLMGKLSLSQIG